MSGVFISISDIRHGEHPHCMEGIRRFCDRTGMDFDALMAGKVTAEEAEATGQLMGMEAARNARERTASKEEV